MGEWNNSSNFHPYSLAVWWSWCTYILKLETWSPPPPPFSIQVITKQADVRDRVCCQAPPSPLWPLTYPAFVIWIGLLFVIQLSSKRKILLLAANLPLVQLPAGSSHSDKLLEHLNVDIQSSPICILVFHLLILSMMFFLNVLLPCPHPNLSKWMECSTLRGFFLAPCILPRDGAQLFQKGGRGSVNFKDKLSQ